MIEDPDNGLAKRRVFIVRKDATNGDIIFMWRVTELAGTIIKAILISGIDQAGVLVTTLGPSHLNLSGAQATGRRTTNQVPLAERYDFLTLAPQVSQCPRTAIPETPYSREFYFTDVDYALTTQGTSVRRRAEPSLRREVHPRSVHLPPRPRTPNAHRAVLAVRSTWAN